MFHVKHKLIVTHLNYIRQPEEEGDDANDQDEHLMVDELLLDPVRKSILNRGDHNLDNRELEEIFGKLTFVFTIFSLPFLPPPPPDYSTRGTTT